MFINRLNLNQLRVFECVYRTKSMTDASRELHLTQSGVSQHIQGLEESLQVKLFDRIKQKLVPTQQATVLYGKSKDVFNSLEETLSSLQGNKNQILGNVNIGMPMEFGNNVIVPLLSKFAEKHSGVRFSIVYGFANHMNEALLNGELDFAFVDSFRLDKRVVREKIYDEVLHLCASPSFLKSKPAIKDQKKYFESFDYVDYQGGEPVLRAWFEHHLKTRHLNFNVRAVGMDARGISRFITSGRAVGILPDHLMKRLESEGHKLIEFKASGRPFVNAISLAYLKDRTASAACVTLRDFLRSELLKPTRSS
jgi:DNA-binding transcriptional LysR family regulator